MSQVRANTSFMVPGRRIVKTGEIFAADDPVIAGRESLFSAIVEAVSDAPKRAAAPAKEVIRDDKK